MLSISPNFVNSFKNNGISAAKPSYNFANKALAFKGNINDGDSFVRQTDSENPIAKAAKTDETLEAQEKIKLAKALTQQGIKAYEKKDFENCIRLMNSAIEASPETSAQAFHCRASANRQLKNYEAAIDDYAKAFELRPDSANSIQLKGQVEAVLSETLDGYEKTSLLRAAIEDYNKALALKELPETYALKAKAQMALHQYKAAIESWDSNIELNEETLAKLEESENPNDKQITALKTALGNAHHIKGNCFRSLADSSHSSYHQKACDEYTKALEYVPRSANTYYERARANYRLDSEACESDIRKAIELADNRAHYWQYLSDILAQSDDEEKRQEGVQALVKAIMLRG